MQFVAKNKEMFLENYYLKNKRAIDKGKNEAPYAWVIPAGQRRRGEAATLRQPAAAAGRRGPHGQRRVHGGQGAGGGRRLRRPHGPAVQPCVAMFLDTQFFAPGNPSPYDDTGWALPLLRNVKAQKVDDKAVARPADDAPRGRCRSRRRDRRHGQRRDRRSQRRHDARAVPLRQQGREDAGGRGGVRGGRPEVRGGRVHHPERRPGEDGGVDQGVRPGGRRRGDARRR